MWLNILKIFVWSDEKSLNYSDGSRSKTFDTEWIVVMGLSQNFLTRIGSIFVARVRPGQPSLVWVWKIFIFSFCVKKNS